MSEEIMEYNFNRELVITPGAIIPEQPKKAEYSKNEFDVTSLMNTVGTVIANEQQQKILYAPVRESDIEIRPDGLVYLPWMHYVARLRDAFGLSWGIIPNGMPKVSNNYIYWGFYLVIDGKLCGFAIGEQQYHPSNATMTYGDACEGAKSNALMRLCKGIGISLELWNPSFVKTWREKYAEQYDDEIKKKKLWRKKNGNDVVTTEPTPVSNDYTFDPMTNSVDFESLVNLNDKIDIIKKLIAIKAYNPGKLKKPLLDFTRYELNGFYKTLKQMLDATKEATNGE